MVALTLCACEFKFIEIPSDNHEPSGDDIAPPADDEAGEDDLDDDTSGDNVTPDNPAHSGVEQDDPDNINFIKGKKTDYRIILPTGADIQITKSLNDVIKSLYVYGINLSYYGESVAETEYEILIGGELSGRENYAFDPHTLGDRGYSIKAVDNKIVIVGGSVDATVSAIKLFFGDCVGLNANPGDITDVKIPKTLSREKIQDDYKIKGITIIGSSLKNYVIDADEADAEAYAAALALQDALYKKAGVWVKMSSGDTTSRRINVKTVEEAGEDGFRVKVASNGLMTVECEQRRLFDKAIEQFIEDNINQASGYVSFDQRYLYELRISSVRYSDFGAKGDGKTDDMAAIIAAHEYANEYELLVEADKDAKYYIGSHHTVGAVIRTDTNWGNAKFIIDDSKIVDGSAARQMWVFTVASDKSSAPVSLKPGFTLSKGQKNIGLKFDSDKLLYIKNSNDKVYIRYGANANSGTDMQEIILVDKNGNVDPSTPIIWDYSTVTSIEAYSISDSPITVKGGNFTTIANLVPTRVYFYRGIKVMRSNTTVYGVKHYIQGEPTSDTTKNGGSSSYDGFFYVQYANNVVFDSCLLTGHTKYSVLKNDGSIVNQGTYDTRANRSNNVTWKNCKQSNDITDTYYWGVMASDFCKNLKFDGSTLSRFDAHMGVHNISIVNSTIGQYINLIGSGTAKIEGTTLNGGISNYLVNLRTDYGATWEGDISIKNCTLVVKNNMSKASAVNAPWTQHDFGYTCYVPNVYIDGFTVLCLNGADYTNSVYVFRNFKSDNDWKLTEDKVNPLVPPRIINVINSPHNYELIQGTNNVSVFENTKMNINLTCVFYSDFGAVGDGVTDDLDAIILAHEYANAYGLPVYADSDATYYIGSGHSVGAMIKTDTYWGDAKFIIDDSRIDGKSAERRMWIFTVASDYEKQTVKIPEGFTLKKGQTNIGMTFDTDMLLYIVNSNHKVYIRYGLNENSGTDMQEVIIVDKNGNVDPSTPIIWDYEGVTSISAYPIIDTPITVSGGSFTTIANLVPTASNYFYRGLKVMRSNTVVYDVEHYVVGEPTPPSGKQVGGSCPYDGFFYVQYANNVVFDRCVMTGRTKYYSLKADYVSQGTYDTRANRSNNVTWKNCTQTNSITDTYYWGIMASDFCKNLKFDGSVLSRFDAHMGVHNISIVNSTVGQAINLIGSGTAYFENVTLARPGSNHFINLRSDYGATWEGNIVIKNCTLTVSNGAKNAAIISALWTRHNFGYTCYLPNLDIDGFTIKHANGNDYTGNVHIFRNFNSNNDWDLREDTVNPYVAPTYIVIKNSNYKYLAVEGSNNDYMFDRTNVSINKEE